MSTALLEKTAEPVAHQVTTGLLKIGLAVKSRAWKEAGAHRVSPTQGQILAFLHARPQRQTALSAIAHGIAVTPATACEAVQVLEKKGLVRKVRSHLDARSVSIALSAKGRKKAKRTAAWPDFLTAAAETLTHAEQKVFLRALIKMIRTLQKRGELPQAAPRPDLGSRR